MMLSAPNIFICLFSMAGIDKGKFLLSEWRRITKKISFFKFLALEVQTL